MKLDTPTLMAQLWLDVAETVTLEYRCTEQGAIERNTGEILVVIYIQQLCGAIVWSSCLEQLFGIVVWSNCVEQLCGATLWSSYVEQLCGAALWSCWTRDMLTLQITKKFYLVCQMKIQSI